VFVVSLPWGRAVLRASAIKNLFAKLPPAGKGSAAAPRGAPGAVKPLTAIGDPKGAPPRRKESIDEPPALPTAEMLRTPAADGRTVFLGTGPVYVFFRLYQLLFERLSAARRLCQEQRGERNLVAHPTDRHSAAQAEKRAKEAGDGSSGDVDMDADGNGNGNGNGGTKGDSAEELYQHFLTALYGVLSGSLDQGKFEDECRNLMGTASYMLFTMERLVNNTVKQFQAVVNDLQVTKMRALWVYQQSLRGGPLDAEVVSSYRSNCAVLLAQRSEDCYAVEYTRNADGTAELVLRHQGRPTGSRDEATVRVEGHGADAPAVRSMIDGRPVKGASHPFLKRTARTGEDAGAGVSSNTLEAGVTAKTGRLVYASGTSDVFVHARDARPGVGGGAAGAGAGDAPMGDA